MTYDQKLAGRIRKLLPRAREHRMFGGIGLMERGHLVAGVSRDDLIVRVPAGETSRWLKEPGARPMMMKRPMKGWVKVSATALSDDAVLKAWINRSRALVESLPSK